MVIITSHLLEANALQKSYRCGRVVLRDATLLLDEGEIVAVTGRNGQGKSTIARILCGTLRPDGGSATFCGQPLVTAQGYNTATRPAIQLIPQQPFASLDPCQRILDAVAEPLLCHRLVQDKRQARARAAELLTSVWLEESIFERRPWQISGGQAQRVAIARALAVRPRLLIADEATAMLDIPAQAQVVSILRELVRSSSISVLLISHDVELVQAVAQRCYNLVEGTLTTQEKVEKVFF